MSKIKIDIEALKANSESINRKIAELQDLNNRLASLIERIQASWEGNASVTYISKIIAQKNKADKMVNVLTEYKEYIDTAVMRFSDVDKQSANKIISSF